MSHASPQRAFALEVVEKLRAAGFEALWAGGCVRDQLLGLKPKDYDVATSATPDEIRALFGRRRTVAIGAAFGVITVLAPRRTGGQIEVATFRSDATYSDGRRPDSVTFTNAREDAVRRDFTINGLFFDPVANEVVDYVGGRQDLEHKLVRAIGDPGLRLSEDKLRMLRAVRFAATFGFTIELQTLAAIQQSAPEIVTVSPERIGMEIRRMLVDRHRAVAMVLLSDTQLFPHVLPEVAALDAPTWRATLNDLAALGTVPFDEPTLSLALTTLLRNAGDASIAGTVGRRLRYTNKEIDRAAWLLASLPITRDAPHVAWPRLQRILTHDGAAELITLHAAVVGPDDPALAFCRERLAWPADRLNPTPLIDGADLIAHGLAPGPKFSRILEAVRDAQLLGELRTKQDALELIDRLSADGLDAPP